MLTIIALILTIIGSLNWMSVGIFGFNAVSYLFSGSLAFVSTIIYVLVGLAGAWLIYYLASTWRTLKHRA